MAWIAGLALWVAGPAGAAIPFKPLQPVPAVAESAFVEVVAPAESLAGVALRMPGPVARAAYDAESRMLLVRLASLHGARVRRSGRGMERPGNEVLLAYDLERRETRWAAKCRADWEALHAGRAILSWGADKAQVDLRSGACARAPAGLTLLEPDQTALILNDQTLGRYDLATGAMTWRRPGPGASWDRIRYRHGDTLYLIANGLHRVNLLTGAGWSYRASTQRGGKGEVVAKELGMAVLAGFLGGLTGRTVMPGGASRENVTHGLFAHPLVGEDRIYFAARRKVARLTADSGRVVWETGLPHETGTMWLVRTGPYLAVLDLGACLVNMARKELASNRLTLLDPETGKILADSALAPREDLKGAVWTREGLVLATRGRLYRFDAGLHAVAVREAGEELGEILGLATREDSLLVSGERGGFAVSPASLEVLGPAALDGVDFPAPPGALDAPPAPVHAALDLARRGLEAPDAPPGAEAARDRLIEAGYMLWDGAWLQWTGDTLRLLPDPAVAGAAPEGGKPE